MPRRLSVPVFHTVFLCIALSGIFAQSDTAIFAPFVSHLKAQVTGTSVTLEWKDSQSVAGPVFIYRSRDPFADTLGDDAQFAEVYYGRQTFTDDPPSQGRWYYLAAASDENQQRYTMTVPFNNMVTFNIDGTDQIVYASGLHTEPARVPPAVIYPRTPVWTYDYEEKEPEKKKPAVQSPPLLTALTAVGEAGGIKVSFVSANPAKHAVLYRNITPIMRLSDLLTADVVQLPGAKSPVMDRVKSSATYYYAVIYDEDLRTGEAVIAPGYNATIYPATASQPAPEQTASAPVYAFPSDTLTPVRTQNTLSLEAAAAISGSNWTTPIPWQGQSAPPVIVQQAPQYILQQDFRQTSIEPHVFKQDLAQSVPGSEEFVLQTIMKESFTWRNWEKAAAELNQLLSRTHNPAVEGRARFYMGQIYYFTGYYNNAMTEFLAVQSRLPEETAVWIQVTLSALSTPR